MAIRKLKINTRLKNNNWSKSHIKNYKNNPWIQTDQTTDTTQISRTQIFKIATNTICKENCEYSSWVQRSLKTKKYKCIIQLMQVKDMKEHLTRSDCEGF